MLFCCPNSNTVLTELHCCAHHTPMVSRPDSNAVPTESQSCSDWRVIEPAIAQYATILGVIFAKNGFRIFFSLMLLVSLFKHIYRFSHSLLKLSSTLSDKTATLCRLRPRLPRHRLRPRSTTTSCRTAGRPTGCSRSGARGVPGPPEPCSLTTPASRTAWASMSLWQGSSWWPSGTLLRWVKQSAAHAYCRELNSLLQVPSMLCLLQGLNSLLQVPSMLTVGAPMTFCQIPALPCILRGCNKCGSCVSAAPPFVMPGIG